MTVYKISLFIHSWLRWVVMVLMIVTIFASLFGWLNRRGHSVGTGGMFKAFRTLLGVQVLVGLILYFATSPLSTWFLYHDLKNIANRPQSFFTLIHPVGMFLAFLVCRVGEQKAFQLTDDVAKFKTWFLFTCIVTGIIMLTIPWPFYPTGRPLFR